MQFKKALIALSAALAGTAVAEHGDCTYFEGTVETGACADKHPTIGGGQYGVAISTHIWDDTAHCGQTLSITGPNGATIQAVVIDRCMGCESSAIDLWQDGFAQLADPSAGRIQVDWRFN